MVPGRRVGEQTEHQRPQDGVVRAPPVAAGHRSLDRPGGDVGDRPPHFRLIVDPCWSRSGSMANPPTADTQATWATVPCTGAQGSAAAPVARPDRAWE